MKTLQVMASVERRMNKLLELEAVACGREPELAKANKARDRLMSYLEKEVEALCEKAGVA